MKSIPLTRGYVALVDDEDYEAISAFKWSAHRHARTCYAARAVIDCGQHRSLLMHRVILNAPPGIQVDHVNGDGLDNRRANLRLATRSQNQHNQRISLANSSGFKGVSYDSARASWRAHIMVNRRRIWLGRFTTAEEAAAAYRAASTKHHGAFGRLE
jgi:hypothetical protein